MDKIKNSDKAQGDQIADKKKEQKASISYAIKAIGIHAKTLRDAGYMDDESYTALQQWRTKTGEEFIRKHLGL